MFVIGKSKSPRCFKGVKNLPYRYCGQGNGWISSELFDNLVREHGLR